MPEVKLSIRRTASTGPYESVTVEVQETQELEDDEIDGAYKALSAKVEKYVRHELRKYKADSDSKTVR